MQAQPAALLTPRDRAILRDVYRFGCLSAVQLAREPWPDSPSTKTALNRLGQLVAVEYLQRRPSWDSPPATRGPYSTPAAACATA